MAVVWRSSFRVAVTTMRCQRFLAAVNLTPISIPDHFPVGVRVTFDDTFQSVPCTARTMQVVADLLLHVRLLLRRAPQLQTESTPERQRAGRNFDRDVGTHCSSVVPPQFGCAMKAVQLQSHVRAIAIEASPTGAPC